MEFSARPSAGETLVQLCDICLAGFSRSFVDLFRHWPFLCLHSHSANANPLVIFLIPPPFLQAAECSPRSDVTFRKARPSAELLFQLPNYWY